MLFVKFYHPIFAWANPPHDVAEKPGDSLLAHQESAVKDGYVPDVKGRHENEGRCLPGCNLSNEKTEEKTGPGCIGDEILQKRPRYVGITISNYKDPVIEEPGWLMESKASFFFPWLTCIWGFQDFTQWPTPFPPLVVKHRLSMWFLVRASKWPKHFGWVDYYLESTQWFDKMTFVGTLMKGHLGGPQNTETPWHRWRHWHMSVAGLVLNPGRR